MERVNSPAPRQRRAFSSFVGPVDSAGEPEAARALAKLFKVDPTQARALSHGFHSYAGRLHPSIARGAIARWSDKQALILDPFCGSGTVLVEAMAAGRRSFGVDASPLAVLIAQTRSTTLGPEGRQRLVETAAEIGEAAAERARKRQRPDVPSWARDEMKRFFPHVAFELLGLRDLISDTPEDDVGRALRLCLSSLLVKFMRRGTEAPRDAETKRIGRGVPSRFFAGRARELAQGLEALEKKVPAGTPPPVIRVGDARHLKHVEDSSAGLIVSSPPYAGTYDYGEHHDVRFLWLSLERTRFDEKQIGAREEGLGASTRAWRDSRRRFLREMGRTLVPGGHAVLVVGDGVVGAFREDAAEVIEADAPGAGLTYVARASQARPIQDRRLREIFGEKPRREHILLLRKD